MASTPGPKKILKEAICLLKKTNIDYLKKGSSALNGRVYVHRRDEYKYCTTMHVLVIPPCGGAALLVIEQERTWDYTEPFFIVKAIVYDGQRTIKFRNINSILHATGCAIWTGLNKLRNLRVRGTGYGLGVRLSERSDLKEDNTYPEHNLTTTFCLELRQK